jgi:hypothetical protein
MSSSLKQALGFAFAICWIVDPGGAEGFARRFGAFC